MICQPVTLDVNGNKVLSTEVTYDDLVILYNDYITKHGKVPLLRDCNLKNNLPQIRIVNRVLDSQGIDYNDFLLQFGKVSHVRTPSDKNMYEYYVNKYIDVCNSIGRTLTVAELTNNSYGLPNSNWFIKYSPYDDIVSYQSFIQHYGLKQNRHVWTKEEVADRLMQLEKEKNRPITLKDITLDEVGFSTIVITRLYGNFSNAKKEIGLLKTPLPSPKPFKYYKDGITEIIEDYKAKTNRKYITWDDIESNKYGSFHAYHKSLRKAFERENVDFDAYLLSLGCILNPNCLSYTDVFEDGEKTDSNLEFIVSTYLRSLGLIYNKDYYRTVKYNSFSDENSNMNCDYVVSINGRNFYIEVAGLINSYCGKWREKEFNNKIENEYKIKMINKEQIFVNNQLPYLLLFADDIRNEKYKDMICDLIGIERR